jgi:hypothetical protein
VLGFLARESKRASPWRSEIGSTFWHDPSVLNVNEKARTRLLFCKWEVYIAVAPCYRPWHITATCSQRTPSYKSTVAACAVSGLGNEDEKQALYVRISD